MLQKKQLLLSFLLLAGVSLSCTREEPKLKVNVQVEDVGCCHVRISATVDNLSKLEQPFFYVVIYSENIKSTGFSELKLSTNKVVEGNKMIIETEILSPNQNYYYTSRFIQNGVNYDTEKRHFATGDFTHGELIDMGLSVRWASYNLGSSSFGDVGTLYAWGETEPKESYTNDNYKWTIPGGYSKYNETDGLTVLLPEDDAATAVLGAPWRMPTFEEINELRENCNWSWAYYFGGVWGFAATSRITGNTIYFPAPSLEIKTYWTASLLSASPNMSKSLGVVSSSLIYHKDEAGYYHGRPDLGYDREYRYLRGAIRPVAP